MLAEILSLVNPSAFNLTARVHCLVDQVSKLLSVEDAQRIDIAATLSYAGGITLPEEVLMK